MTPVDALTTHRPKRLGPLTPLNLATSAAFDRCAGKHVPSGETITRWFPGADRVLNICARCRCPYGAPKQNWSSGTTVGRTKRGPKMPE